MLSLAMADMAMEATPGPAMGAMATGATPRSAMVTGMDMDIVATAMATAAIAGQAIPTMDMEVTTSVMPMLSLAMADMAMEATPGQAMGAMATGATPVSAMVMDMDMDIVVKAMVTAATAAQATPAMDMGVTTSVMLRLSQVMEVMATGMVATAMVTAAIAGLAIPTVDMEVTTSVMPMLSLATADMAMEATPGPAMGDTVMGATPTCTDLHKDLVHHMDTDQMVTTKLNQMRPNHETSKAKKTHQ